MLFLPSARATSAGRVMNSWSCWERSIRRLMRISDPRIVANLAEIHVELQHGAALAGLTSLGIGGMTGFLRLRKDERLPDFLDLLAVNHLAHNVLCGCSDPLLGEAGLAT